MDCRSIVEFVDAVNKGTRHVQLWEIPRLTDEDIITIIKATHSHCATFTQLGFFRCGLSTNQLGLLCDGVSSRLDHLLLQYSNVGDNGVKHLVRLLERKDCGLERLFVCDDSVADEGITQLAQTIRKNKSLKLLCITDNPISKHGLQALQDMLKDNTTLRTLNFSMHRIPDLDINDVIKFNALCRNPRMRADCKRIEALCFLANAKHAKHSAFKGFPIDLCRIVKDMLCERLVLMNPQS